MRHNRDDREEEKRQPQVNMCNHDNGVIPETVTEKKYIFKKQIKLHTFKLYCSEFWHFAHDK